MPSFLIEDGAGSGSMNNNEERGEILYFIDERYLVAEKRKDITDLASFLKQFKEEDGEFSGKENT